MRKQMLKISGHKTDKSFYDEFPDEASFMKKHGKEFQKAKQGARLQRITYGDKYDDIDMGITGSTAAQRNMANMPAPQQEGGGKKGSGIGEMMGAAKSAYSIYQGFSGGGASAAGSAAGSAGSTGSMMSGIMGMFKKNGGPIKKVSNKGKIKKAGDGTVMGPQNDPGAPDWYKQNNPYFALEPGPTNNPIASQAPAGVPQMPTGPQAVSSVDKKPTGANAANAPGNGYKDLDPVENKMKGWGKTMGKIDFLGISGKLISGIGALKAEKEMKKRAKQSRDLSALTLQAARSTDVDADRFETNQRTNQREMQMPVNTGEEFFPIYGTGKEPLARDGIHIKPENRGKFTAYKKRTGKTTEEALHSSSPHVRQMANFARNASKWDHTGNKKAFAGGSFSNYTSGMGGSAAGGAASGGGTPWGMIGEAGGGIASQATGNNAGGQLGGTVGEAIGTYWGPAGRAIGKIAGTAIGGLVDTNPKKTKKYTKQANKNMAQETAIGMGAGIQNQYGSVVRDGGKLQKLDDGGNIESGSLGGKIKTLWGGGVETISSNPYLPNSGETAMLRGASHEDGGIGVAYSDDSMPDKVSAEAEGGEPIYEVLNPEGEAEAVVAGNLKISKENAMLLGDKNAANKKFKNYVNDLSKKEDRSNKVIESAKKEYEDFTPITSFDKAKNNSLKLNMMGADMRLKAIAHKKEMAAGLQSAINDSAEEHGLSAEHLAIGKYKKASKDELARFGKKLSKLEDGGPIKSRYESEMEQYEDAPVYSKPVSAKKQASIDQTKSLLHAPDTSKDLPSNSFYNRELEYLEDSPVDNPTVTRYDASVPDANKKNNLFSKDNIDKAMTGFNQVLPYLRKSDKEDLDNNQLMGENFALGNNKVEPVYAKGYNPLLDIPYDITLQEMRNENRAATRAAERMAGYNPAAASMIASEAYAANQKIGAEEFRMNQGRRDQASVANRSAMNTAQLKNMEIYDQQYVRQSQAKSNTKAITQAALSSISEKFAKNKLENRKLQTYENLYNYRFDKDYKAVNQNGMQTFDTSVKNLGEDPDSEVENIAQMEDKLYDYKAKKRAERKARVSRDGSILQNLKRI
jgi:hypothetical protein